MLFEENNNCLLGCFYKINELAHTLGGKKSAELI